MIELEDVTVRFGGLTAVDRVSFKVSSGVIHGLIGPNGSGKTSTFNAVTGFYPITSGRVRIDGVDTTGWPIHRIAQLGVVRTFQTSVLQAERTVLENVLVGAYGRGDSLLRRLAFRDAEARDIEAVDEALEWLGLGDYRNVAAKNLPIGMRSKTEIARALVSKPRVMLFDEPSAGLNNAEAVELVNLIRRIRDTGVTVLIVEHDMKVIMSMCERITVLASGARIAEGTPAEIRANPEVIKSYLGQEKV